MPSWSPMAGRRHFHSSGGPIMSSGGDAIEGKIEDVKIAQPLLETLAIGGRDGFIQGKQNLELGNAAVRPEPAFEQAEIVFLWRFPQSRTPIANHHHIANAIRRQFKGASRLLTGPDVLNPGQRFETSHDRLDVN